MLSRIVVIVVVVAALLAGLLYSQRKPSSVQVSGFIEADDIHLGSRVGGRVKSVLVREGQRVQAGEVLVELEPHDLQARLNEAEAKLAAQKANVDRLEAGLLPEEVAQVQARMDRLSSKVEMLVAGARPEEIETARAWLTLAEAQADRAKKTHARAMDLFNRDARTITREDVDKAIEDLHVAESTIQARQEQLQLLTKGTREEEVAAARAELAEAKAALDLAKKGYRKEELQQAQAEMRATEAALAAIQVQMHELKIVANVAGTVDALELQPGDLVAPNSPVLTLLDLENLWLRAYIPEDQLSWQPGDAVEVSVDGFPNQRIQGTISFIAGQGEFTPRNVQTPEERAKQVFRIKVKLPSQAGLRVGMGADLWLPPAREKRATVGDGK